VGVPSHKTGVNNKSKFAIMKLSCILCLLFCLVSFSAFSSDKYQVGDTMFIWAKSGLHLRENPDLNSRILSSLYFGEEIVVQGLTNNRINLNGISKVSNSTIRNKIGPVIFRGHWVQVRTKNGDIGYVVDQYIMQEEPANKNVFVDIEMNLKIINVDTIYKSPTIHDGSGLNLTLRYEYDNGVEKIEDSGGYWSETRFVFPGYSFEEVLVLFGDSWIDY